MFQNSRFSVLVNEVPEADLVSQPVMSFCPHLNSVAADAGFGTAGGFGTSAFGTTTNAGGLFGSTQNKPGLSDLVSFTLVFWALKKFRSLYCLAV